MYYETEKFVTTFISMNFLSTFAPRDYWDMLFMKYTAVQNFAGLSTKFQDFILAFQYFRAFFGFIMDVLRICSSCLVKRYSVRSSTRIFMSYFTSRRLIKRQTRQQRFCSTQVSTININYGKNGKNDICFLKNAKICITILVAALQCFSYLYDPTDSRCLALWRPLDPLASINQTYKRQISFQSSHKKNSMTTPALSYGNFFIACNWNELGPS